MPVHDWTRVDTGIFLAFHCDWLVQISRALNGGLLPDRYYALPEQIAGGLGPDGKLLVNDSIAAIRERLAA